MNVIVKKDDDYVETYVPSVGGGGDILDFVETAIPERVEGDIPDFVETAIPERGGGDIPENERYAEAFTETQHQVPAVSEESSDTIQKATNQIARIDYRET